MIESEVYLHKDILAFQRRIGLEFQSEAKPVVEGDEFVYLKDKVPEYFASPTEEKACSSCSLGSTMILVKFSCGGGLILGMIW